MNNQSTHISHQEIKDYLKNQLGDSEMHRIEHHMLHCEFCAEAMEGYEILEEDDDKAIVALQNKLNKRTEAKEEPLDYKIIFAVAATTLLLMWGGWQFFIVMNEDMGNQIAEVVKEEPQEKEEKQVEKTVEELEDLDAESDSFEEEVEEEIMEAEEMVLEMNDEIIANEEPSIELASGSSQKIKQEELKTMPGRFSQVAQSGAGAVSKEKLAIAKVEDKVKEFEKSADLEELMELSEADSDMMKEVAAFAPDVTEEIAIPAPVEEIATMELAIVEEEASQEKSRSSKSTAKKSVKSKSAVMMSSPELSIEENKSTLAGTYSFNDGDNAESYSLKNNGTFNSKTSEGLKQTGNWETNGDTLLLYFKIPDNEQILAPTYFLSKDNGLYKVLVIPEGKIVEYDKFFKKE